MTRARDRRRACLPLLTGLVLALTGHGAAAQSGGVECPAALRTPGARSVAAEVLADLRVHKDNTDPDTAFRTFQRNFGNAALMNLPGTEYADNKAVFDRIDRATVAACFPPLAALLTNIEQKPQRQAQQREQAAAEQQAAEQRAVRARQQADAEAARQAAAAVEAEQQRADEANRALRAEEQVLDDRQRRQLLADEAERAQREKERLQQGEQRAAEAAAEKARQAEQQRQAAEAARKMQAEAVQKQQAEEAEHDRTERAWFAEASKPRNVLVNAYRNYIAVRNCAASRDGYAVVYVVPERLGQARAEIRAIEANALRQDPSIDKDAAWQEANGPDRLPDPDATPTDQMLKAIGQAAVEGHTYNDQGQTYCATAAYIVDQLAKAADPASGVVRKDF